MYNAMTAKEDQKVVENWRSDADSAVITVRRCVSLPAQPSLCSAIVEWSLFSYGCYSTGEVIPGLEAHFAGCLSLLSFSDLSAIGWPQWHLYRTSLSSFRPIHILTDFILYLDLRPVVSKPSNQPRLYGDCNTITTMGSTIPSHYSGTTWPTQPCTDP